jgi:hypothetical protein
MLTANSYKLPDCNDEQPSTPNSSEYIQAKILAVNSNSYSKLTIPGSPSTRPHKE